MYIDNLGWVAVLLAGSIFLFSINSIAKTFFKKRNNKLLEDCQKANFDLVRWNNELRLKCVFFENVKIVICKDGNYGITLGDTTIVLRIDGKFVRINDVETSATEKKES